MEISVDWASVRRIAAAYPVAPPPADRSGWASVGRIVQAWSRVPTVVESRDWSPAARMIDAAVQAQGGDRQELTRLLKESKRLLRPLEDPFSTDFALHRWLRGSREEVYSDWLAWSLDQLDSAADVFRLFGVDPFPQADQWASGQAERESPIPDGRLDIVRHWPGKALLVVEVKLTTEEFASTDKQKLYRDWMRKHREPHNEAVLLVVDAESGESKGGFKCRDWRKVCLGLRCAAVRKSKGAKIIPAALLLAFAGAVEQNLMDMPGTPLELMRQGCLLNLSRVYEHLKAFHRSVDR
jgi:hypothetical protein